MAIVTGDRYVELLLKFVEKNAGSLLEGVLILKLNPVGLHYVQSRLEALQELERLRSGAPVDYLRAYIADLGDHRALERLRRVLRLLTSLKVVSVLPHPNRDPTPLPLLPFGRLRCLELRGCDLSTSAARGLLELRHTLEKLVCHNSTDALRHIFAGRIVDIQDCPVWTRLSFVSCAGNNMVLMDESLQLLPVVETLDLSRNRFAKIDNLRKCTKLKHLDLGFNHIRTISSLNEDAFGISKLILRNNALTTLHGIENLITLEALDLSYNMISNFAEIELLASLPSLDCLWLEGNPISFARLYRQQVFSFFSEPRKLKLDEKAISGREAWTVKVIVARRRKQRGGHGFYAPAKCEIQSDVNNALRSSCGLRGANRSGHLQKTKRKLSRLACIEDSEFNRCLLSEGLEQDESCSPSCESETQRRDKTDTGESVRRSALDLMSRIELLKREKSPACFLELMNLLNHTDEDHLQGTNYNSRNKPAHPKSRRQPNKLDDSSIEDLVGMEGSIEHSERDFQEAELLETRDEMNNAHTMVNEAQENSLRGSFSPKARTLSKSLAMNVNSFPLWPHSETREVNSSLEGLKGLECDAVRKLPNEHATSSLPVNVADEEMGSIDEIIESRSSSYYHGSPPHYEKDILDRRQNMEDEFMQLSFDSYSYASSSDSETSGGDELYLSDSSRSIDGQPTTFVNTEEDITGIESDIVLEDVKEVSDRRQHGSLVKDPSFNVHNWPDSSLTDDSKLDHDMPSCSNGILANAGGGNLHQYVGEGISHTIKTISIRKQKKRVVLLDEDRALNEKCEQSFDSSKSLCISSRSIRNGMRQLESMEDELNKLDGKKEPAVKSLNRVNDPCANCAEASGCNSYTTKVKFEDPIELYFHNQVADIRVSETCVCYVRCSCMRIWEDDPEEREVAVLLSSEIKLYILLTSSELGQPSIALRVLGSHKLQDIGNILVGIGLQALRVNFGYSAAYLFLTRSIVNSRKLLVILGKCPVSTPGESFDFPLQSWEHVQIKLFEKCLGDVRPNIIQYAMLLFEKGGAWFARSLFLTPYYIFLCVEDLVQFGSVSNEDLISEPYFLLEAWSSISNILELVIEPKQLGSATLVFSDIMCRKFQLAMTKRVLGTDGNKETYKDDFGQLVWKLKGFADDTLLKFITLLKAVYMGATMQPLPVKHVV